MQLFVTKDIIYNNNASVKNMYVCMQIKKIELLMDGNENLILFNLWNIIRFI